MTMHKSESCLGETEDNIRDELCCFHVQIAKSYSSSGKASMQLLDITPSSSEEAAIRVTRRRKSILIVSRSVEDRILACFVFQFFSCLCFVVGVSQMVDRTSRLPTCVRIFHIIHQTFHTAPITLFSLSFFLGPFCEASRKTVNSCTVSSPSKHTT